MEKLSKKNLRTIKEADRSCDVADGCLKSRRERCPHYHPEFTRLLRKFGRGRLVDPRNDNHVYCEFGGI